MTANLNGLLGMCEMELAVGYMLQKAADNETEIGQISVDDGDIHACEKLARVGFYCLLAHGWLETSYPNGCFVASNGLIERLRKLPELSNLSDPPTFPAWMQFIAEDAK